jgi:Ca-activated chloride channel family protein
MVRRRQGAGLPIALASAAAIGLLLWAGARGGGFASLWLTADQRGALAYARRDFAEAAVHFDNPAWKARAAYAAGRYEEAAASFARIPSATGFFNRGNALMKNREYELAISAYEQAVAMAPDWAEARENLALSRYVLGYIERAREQGDTGEQQDLGADDTVYDNSRDRGEDTEVSRESALEAQSAEKWMRSVNTETSDFLRSRFALEAAREAGT